MIGRVGIGEFKKWHSSIIIRRACRAWAMELEGIKLSKSLVKTILVETSKKKKGLGRTLMNYALSEFELSGNILDLGSSSDSASYNRFLKYKAPFNVTYSDYYQRGKNLVQINLEEPFEIQENSFDYVMCFNALEHVYNFKNVIEESHRILKENGVFIGSTPFLHQFHPDPYDYFRYTHQALVKMFEEQDYVCERIIYLGFGPFSLAASQWNTLVPTLFRPIVLLLNIFLDMLLNKVSKSYQMKHPFGYVYAFKKRSKSIEADTK